MSYPDFIAKVYQSERLVYRALEDNAEDRQWLAENLLNDPTDSMLRTWHLPKPRSASAVQIYYEYSKSSLVDVLICLPPSIDSDISQEPDAKPKPTPIGHISLFGGAASRDTAHHRNATIGVSITAPYRGKGYGGEAINWAVDWGFRRAGLHRISIAAFSFNTAALGLYRKLGFKDEGRERETVLFDRQWHDAVSLGMLEQEWEELRGIKGSSGV